MQSKKFNKFPVTSGLSGAVFSSGKLYICNDAEQENNFVDEIDNQTQQHNVQNFMIGPVYGKNKNQPVGIIQFINKLGTTPIGPDDRHKFEEMADLIGLCIENTNSITQTVNVTLMINKRMRNIQKIMTDENQHHEQQPTTVILDDLYKRFKEINIHSEKLMKDRAKEKGNASYFETYLNEFKRLGFQ